MSLFRHSALFACLTTKLHIHSPISHRHARPAAQLRQPKDPGRREFPPMCENVRCDSHMFETGGRYQKFETDKVLSFVPPDGHFKLMSYRTKERYTYLHSPRPTHQRQHAEPIRTPNSREAGDARD
ncbi:hypothetical protein BC938DRAFT_473745 [Jimgerdemannia flammicorona]|uniref:MHD domain-containing protein n=1 Tax=Jimgerdemannia flammicorona TaxID=994334 RepID=A0A433Q3L0_9FUNG|nr:hypothetical protein BC938DRAFT_473745 [Jimgerdemannia flammicorona]